MSVCKSLHVCPSAPNHQILGIRATHSPCISIRICALTSAMQMKVHMHEKSSPHLRKYQIRMKFESLRLQKNNQL